MTAEGQGGGGGTRQYLANQRLEAHHAGQLDAVQQALDLSNAGATWHANSARKAARTTDPRRHQPSAAAPAARTRTCTKDGITRSSHPPAHGSHRMGSVAMAPSTMLTERRLRNAPATCTWPSWSAKARTHHHTKSSNAAQQRRRGASSRLAADAHRHQSSTAARGGTHSAQVSASSLTAPMKEFMAARRSLYRF